ncbi:glycosyltransferase [Celeribacter halophilus]|uniref:UDP-N-acetylglucosamine transferase subunit ALG13 n=1 Tax=Celeribacter halophilus TaxID=576117 RepID=A0A1I3WGR1_9RHOB|nr:glycosyltransferase [Celeribacter halophilus]PZX09852.1 UDP-N-acetylglucosamine transferase subunit ALG13 [Celeribacter halophilus]SFK06748.1 UDP-N-acetylglucosamine transferase subunit ALG13 [Celeribacter halophilus]
MIFVTLGTQLPFDRLVSMMDNIAQDVGEEIFGQIGHGKYQPVHFPCVPTLSQKDFTQKVQCARVIVGHAGIGTLLSAQKMGKPVAIVARRSHLGEHRNDHQLATVSQLGRISGVYVCETGADLKAILTREELEPMSSGISQNRADLIARLRREVDHFVTPC